MECGAVHHNVVYGVGIHIPTVREESQGFGDASGFGDIVEHYKRSVVRMWSYVYNSVRLCEGFWVYVCTLVRLSVCVCVSTSILVRWSVCTSPHVRTCGVEHEWMYVSRYSACVCMLTC